MENTSLKPLVIKNLEQQVELLPEIDNPSLMELASAKISSLCGILKALN